MYETALKRNPRDGALASKIGQALVKTHHFGKVCYSEIIIIIIIIMIIIIIIITIIMFNTSIALFTFTYDQKRFTNFKNPF